MIYADSARESLHSNYSFRLWIPDDFIVGLFVSYRVSV